MDKQLAADWLKLRPESVITLRDAQAIEDSMRRGLGVGGIDYTVRSVERCDQVDGLCTHLLLTLVDPQQPTYLLVKIVDELVDLYAFFEVPGLPSGTREELLDRGMHWLFQAPPNPNAFDPMDLAYTMTIHQNVPAADGGASQELIYRMKSQGEIQCEHVETPGRKGIEEKLLATVVEYRTEGPTENPELLVLEVGDPEGARSYVRFFLGCGLRMAEVDVLAR